MEYQVNQTLFRAFVREEV